MKKLLEKVNKVMHHPQMIPLKLLYSPLGRAIPDEPYLKTVYRLKMVKKLNLENPQTFNEKLQWLKLHDRKPEYTMMADKYEVRKYIAETIGEEYLIPLLGVWDDPDEIDFDGLPQQFVLKCNHNSGLGMTICKDKSQLDIEQTKKELKRGLKQQYYWGGREWQYKNIKPKIVCEQYMVDESSGDLKDYKFMCFHGKVQCTFICSERESDLKVTFYDNHWNKMDFIREYPSSKKEISQPIHFEKMVSLAQQLSSELQFLRVDFYEVAGKIYFGELTFHPGGGMKRFRPEEWDHSLGSWIDLS